MNTLLLLAIAAIIIVFILFKWHTIKSRLAFLFILLGLLVVIFFIFLMVNGSGFSFAGLDSAISSIKGYFLFIKGLIVNVFDFTGKVIGTAANNSTG